MKDSIRILQDAQSTSMQAANAQILTHNDDIKQLDSAFNRKIQEYQQQREILEKRMEISDRNSCSKDHEIAELKSTLHKVSNCM